MFKIFNRGLSIFTNNFAALKVNGTEVLDKDGKIGLGQLRSGIAPSHIVVAAGQHTTAGGDTAEQATVAGVVATDIVICSLESNGTNDSTLISGAAGAGVIDFVLNEDPGTDVIINYMVLRAAA